MTLQRLRLTKLTATIGIITMLYACGTRTPVTESSSGSTATGNNKSVVLKQTSLDPKIEHEFDLGVQAMMDKNYDKAEDIFLNMTLAYPNLSGPFANLGTVLGAKKDYANAELAFRNALQLNPNNAETFNHLGMLYRQTGRFQEALQIYKQGLMIAPKHSNLLRNTGILLELYLNSPDAALKYYQRYLEEKPGDGQVQLWASILKQQAGS